MLYFVQSENCSVPDESLSTLSFGLKCSITFRLIKQRQWTEACTFFEGYIHHASVDTNVTGESIALNHICNERMLSSHVWLAEFIKKMVEEDLVHFRKIKLKPDETYLHSSVKIAFATGNVILPCYYNFQMSCYRDSKATFKGFI